MTDLDLSRPLNLNSREFVDNKHLWYARLRDEAPVHQVKISIMKIWTVSRYDDCAALLKDPRMMRNRGKATGKRNPLPIPIPKSLNLMLDSMIQSDDPEHRRLRELVRKAFRPQAIALLENQLEAYSHELLDQLPGEFDLQRAYALPIPTRMITNLLGVEQSEAEEIQKSFSILTEGFSGMRALKTLFFGLPSVVKQFRGLIRRKAQQPGDDILTGLIQAEHEGDRLTEDELVAMTLLLVIAGYETTVHLITNGIHALLTHPDQLERLRADPSLIDSTVEEVLRFCGPVYGTKMQYAREPVEFSGITIPAGEPIMPLLGAGNRDPRHFDNPETFDIGRNPNHHLGFGYGVHYCLGAHLARLETKIAVRSLLDRFPDLSLADPANLSLVAMPGWHRYRELPVTTRALRQAA